MGHFILDNGVHFIFKGVHFIFKGLENACSIYPAHTTLRSHTACNEFNVGSGVFAL